MNYPIGGCALCNASLKIKTAISYSNFRANFTRTHFYLNITSLWTMHKIKPWRNKTYTVYCIPVAKESPSPNYYYYVRLLLLLYMYSLICVSDYSILRMISPLQFFFWLSNYYYYYSMIRSFDRVNTGKWTLFVYIRYFKWT